MFISLSFYATAFNAFINPFNRKITSLCPVIMRWLFAILRNLVMDSRKQWNHCIALLKTVSSFSRLCYETSCASISKMTGLLRNSWEAGNSRPNGLGKKCMLRVLWIHLLDKQTYNIIGSIFWVRWQRAVMTLARHNRSLLGCRHVEEHVRSQRV